MSSQETLGELKYQRQEDVEDLEGYHGGGYHPINLEDEISHCRYRIVHKLGFGSYSTVWLARDQQEKRYVALKIIVAEASRFSSKSRILSHLYRSSIGRFHPGRASVPFILDEFFLEGPNGRHLCLVGEPAGCSVAESKEASRNWMF